MAKKTAKQCQAYPPPRLIPTSKKYRNINAKVEGYNYNHDKVVHSLYVNSTAKLDSSGPKPRNALEYFSAGTSRFLSNFIPKHSV